MRPATDEGGDCVARAEALAGLFHRPPAVFAAFAPVRRGTLPEPFGRLLDHASHMTVAMERFYGAPVGVDVVAVRDDGVATGGGPGWYEREILLHTANGRVVQHGIVRIDLAHVTGQVATSIRAGKSPLGRILIAAGLLLDVQHVGLLDVAIGPRLAALLGREARPTERTFGRVAGIAVAGVPAVELLEIVAPGALPKVLR
ncbi:MAG: hypothetical protein EBR28_07100 [Planctomycetia bacterium]|nr:hypothetical protein [Planctomycetia bacterium]